MCESISWFFCDTILARFCTFSLSLFFFYLEPDFMCSHFFSNFLVSVAINRTLDSSSFFTLASMSLFRFSTYPRLSSSWSRRFPMFFSFNYTFFSMCIFTSAKLCNSRSFPFHVFTNSSSASHLSATHSNSQSTSSVRSCFISFTFSSNSAYARLCFAYV